MKTKEQTIPKGYKQTDMGVLPMDWSVDLLPKTLTFLSGKAHEKFIVEDGKYIAVNSKFISSDGTVRKYTNHNFCPAKKGDVLMVMSDLPNGKALAKCFLVDADNRYAVNQRVCILRAKKDYRAYFFYSLNRHPYFLQFDDGVQQTHLLNNVFKKCLVVVPNKKEEQIAIATALSDADALIEKLKKLIEKKKNIKQGAMQELLTGKRRLLGFSEKWATASLLEIADHKKELFDDGDWIESEHITTQGIRLIQTGNIGVGRFVGKETKKYIYEESFHKLNCKLLLVGDLLICRLAEPAGRACVLPDIGEEKIVTSVDVTIFRPGNSYDRRFLAQVFSTKEWFEKVLEDVGGTTHKRISRGNLGQIKIQVPKIDEQKAIATVLSDMDAEIERLESQLSKYQNLKQGMMQTLLNGKIRLI